MNFFLNIRNMKLALLAESLMEQDRKFKYGAMYVQCKYGLQTTDFGGDNRFGAVW